MPRLCGDYCWAKKEFCCCCCCWVTRQSASLAALCPLLRVTVKILLAHRLWCMPNSPTMCQGSAAGPASPQPHPGGPAAAAPADAEVIEVAQQHAIPFVHSMNASGGFSSGSVSDYSRTLQTSSFCLCLPGECGGCQQGHALSCLPPGDLVLSSFTPHHSSTMSAACSDIFFLSVLARWCSQLRYIQAVRVHPPWMPADCH